MKLYFKATPGRGVPSLAPENTMTSYRKAYELGADMIETDVQMTKDGKLVIMHDYNVDRTTNGTSYVKDLTLEQIRTLDAGIKFSLEFQGVKRYLSLKSF
ncbi:glycerophosphodiester phosphodiesterase [Bacillus sp. CGMCC 1.60114]|uniref:glycerophosphodiester phosphodiesterase n=1 Tax=unclassified Bacillus (in: firmicutes) TaxID=185979 RepID=UPI00364523BF